MPNKSAYFYLRFFIGPEMGQCPRFTSLLALGRLTLETLPPQVAWGRGQGGRGGWRAGWAGWTGWLAGLAGLGCWHARLSWLA